MALELTPTAQALTTGVEQDMQLVLVIDGVETVFGVGTIKKYIRIGDPGLKIGNDWVIGGYNDVNDQEDLITFEGSTTSIRQQLLQDRGGVSSIGAIQISLQDRDNIVTELISPGQVVRDIMGRKAWVYLGYNGTAYPDDFVQLFAGIIDEVDAGSMNIVLNVASPEAGKRFDIYQERATNLTQVANFRSAVIQGLKFKTRFDVSGTVTVVYTSGGVDGSELVTVVGNTITVAIAVGFTTAQKVRNAIEKSVEALALVTVAIVTNEGGTIQATHSTPLNSDTTIHVDSTAGFLLPADSGTLRTYIRINNELIEYTGKTPTTFTGCVRAAFVEDDERTQGQQHAVGDEVSTWYRLTGNTFELALKTLLSGENEYFTTEQKPTSIQSIPGFGDVPNAIYFEGVNIQDRYGLTIGDYVTSVDDSHSENNFILRVITAVEIINGGSYIVVDGAAMFSNPNPEGTVSFKSKYNVLPEGAGLNLGPDQVDVPEFERLLELHFSSILNRDLKIKETQKGKDFIDTTLLFPTGAYSIPRKGKTSVGFTSPPLAVSLLPVFDSNNTKMPQQARIKRSINKYFYNAVAFRFNEDLLDDKFLSNTLDFSADSKDQIKVQNKILVIDAPGVLPTPENLSILEILEDRMLERYRFAAEHTEVKTVFGESFWLDVGDPMLYGDQDLQLVDTRKAQRGFEKRIWEIINKSVNVQTGEIVLLLLDTQYLSEGRYGVFGPASLVGSGSTEEEIIIKNSFATVFPKIEKSIWEGYIGELIRVHAPDFSFDETTKLVSFDPANNYKMLVDPPLSIAPPEDYIVDMPEYQGTDEEGIPYKNQHCFADPTVEVVSGIDDFNFEVGSADTPKFFVGATIKLHNPDYSLETPEVKVLEVNGDIITTDASLGLTVDNTFVVELIGFAIDEGSAYRFI